MPVWRVKRGPKGKLPDLAEGELGYCTDSGELYVGTAGANNVGMATQATVAAAVAGHAVSGTHPWDSITGKPAVFPADDATLPIASASSRGVVQVGDGLAVDGAGVLSATGAGAGDMLQSAYDSNADNKVNAADTADAVDRR